MTALSEERDVHYIEIHPGHAADAGDSLHRFLSAHLARERAAARRRLCVHLCALFAVLLWLAVMLSPLRGLRSIVFGLFAGAVFGSLVSLALELRSLKSLRAAEKSVRTSAASKG